MRKIFTLTLTLILSYTAYSQDFNLPESKHKPIKWYNELGGYLASTPIAYSLGYNHHSFLNSTYNELYENAKIEPAYGYYFNMRYNGAFPLLLELEYTATHYQLNEAGFLHFEEGTPFVSRAIKASADWVLLPSAKFFMPYAGVGYAYSTDVKGNGLFDDSEQYASSNESMPYWEAGVLLNLHPYFYLSGEYEQSFKPGKATSYRQYNMGIGFRLSYENTYANHRDYLDYVPVEYAFGYSHIQLKNDPFLLALDKGRLSHQYGYYYNLRITKLLPLIFDIGYSEMVYELKTESEFYEFATEGLLGFKNFEAGLNLTLPARNFLLPYIGAGVSYNQMAIGTNLFDSKASDIIQQTSNESYWKTGLMVNVKHGFFFNAEYKQTFSRNKQFSYNQLKGGMGFRTDADGMFKDQVKEDLKYYGSVILSGGYHQTDFINSVYKHHRKENNIKRKFGGAGNLRIAAAYPLLIDLGYFSSQYQIEDISGWPNDSSRVRHRGGELALSLAFLSETRYFIPYLGAGYQYSQLYTGEPFAKEEGVSYDHLVEMAVNTSSPIFKVGFMMNFDLMAYMVEYKHSLFNTKHPFYQLSITAGIRM